MDYRKFIITTAKKNESMRAFAYRMSNSSNVITASVREAWWPFGENKPQQQPAAKAPQQTKVDPNKKVFIIFTFDKKTDTMHVTQDGREIVTFKGEDAWGKAIDFFKRKFVRKELLPQMTHFLFTGKKGLIDISGDFKLSNRG